MIRKAEEKDIEIILSITQACAKSMVDNKIYQWNETYPNRAAFQNDINRHELFVLENNKTIQGCIVISTFMDSEYESIDWLTKNDRNIYIHRLAIHPKHQGKGYAQKLMDFAEQFAIENNYTSIRLDTFSQNKRNQKFYELRGYNRLGEIYFPNQSKYPFYCYELVL
ncbi:ribosomal protein S18 acetylase RimI-like enzyme [Winogradskyella epiphytica]|uniref:Ribosomal protein S18 acetylase RimI-like enzyme n=1 Tax=Winogradskyella epiphytica TaxID=262005 RepID=A0A2V4XMS7_9FLAO|nr:GNAT family N-acetyltransferase [Winogradskyella epiphytica]PYE83389.1 ribosomal protein S18 acetylase RimI-like enzyme [Winogradskyella epiphytica]GGW57810.1 N-acetyltransferase [Winogradskyella epiphytica]